MTDHLKTRWILLFPSLQLVLHLKWAFRRELGLRLSPTLPDGFNRQLFDLHVLITPVKICSGVCICICVCIRICLCILGHWGSALLSKWPIRHEMEPNVLSKQIWPRLSPADLDKSGFDLSWISRTSTSTYSNLLGCGLFPMRCNRDRQTV